MSTATQGRAREHKVRDAMILHGWEPIFRAAASKGPADIGMAHEDHGLALVQVGTGNKTLGPVERARLLRAAWLCSALPIVAQVIPRPGKPSLIKWQEVTDGPPSTWREWKP
jgi:hypothetical protein